jgi:CTP:molybdopterin cytidylyltransferase MocA
MRILIVTAAGSARRFNRDTNIETAKCIFYHDNPRHALLYQLCEKSKTCDKIIIVGGYKYTEVARFIESHMPFLSDKIEMVYNQNYETYGSAYSLVLGIEATEKMSPDEIIFAEGDLYFSAESFDKIIISKKEVVTINMLPICAERSVVFYENTDHRFKYLYDTKHSELYIEEPFAAIYNSAQIWKFIDAEKLFLVTKNLSEKQRSGTNLEIINAYFSKKPAEEIEIVVMHDWVNCNTIRDYYDVIKIISGLTQ